MDSHKSFRKGILFQQNNSLELEAYIDADYAGSIVDRRSTTGYCTFLGGNWVTWRCKKQRSSIASKFWAILQWLCELLWLKIILDDLPIKGKKCDKVVLQQQINYQYCT